MSNAPEERVEKDEAMGAESSRALLDDFGVRSSGSANDVLPLAEALLSNGCRAFGPYVLLGKLGEGGMAEVHLALEHAPTGEARPCVIKLISPHREQNETFRLLFREEARVSSWLAPHPNIVSFYGSGEIEGTPYIAYELVDGLTLGALERMTDPDPVPLRCALEIARSVSEGLAHAHSATRSDGSPLALVHRDISPQNVLLSRSGIVKVADFGIARFTGRAYKTVRHVVIGKRRYMAPEQYFWGNVDAKADVFSLGVVLLELILGRRDFLAAARTEAPSEDRIRELLAAHGRVPSPLVELIESMTASSPEARPTSAMTWETLSRILDGLEPGPSLQDFIRDGILPKLRLIALDYPTATEGVYDRERDPAGDTERNEREVSSTALAITSRHAPSPALDANTDAAPGERPYEREVHEIVPEDSMMGYPCTVTLKLTRAPSGLADTIIAATLKGDRLEMNSVLRVLAAARPPGVRASTVDPPVALVSKTENAGTHSGEEPHASDHRTPRDEARMATFVLVGLGALAVLTCLAALALFESLSP